MINKQSLPEEVRISNNTILKSVIKRKSTIVPFVGAGVSIACGLMDWNNLARKFAKNYLNKDELRECKGFSPIKLADKVFSKTPDNQDHLYDYLAKLIEGSKIDICNCQYLPMILNDFYPFVITTNYDLCLEEADKGNLYNTIKSPKNFESINRALQSGEKTIVHLHGSVKDPSSLVFESIRYRKVYGRKNNSPIASVLQTCFASHSSLFIGCSLQENNEDKTVEVLRNCIKNTKEIEHYAILEYPGSLDRFKEMNLRLTGWGIFPIFYPSKQYGLIYNILHSIENLEINSIDDSTDIFFDDFEKKHNTNPKRNLCGNAAKKIKKRDLEIDEVSGKNISDSSVNEVDNDIKNFYINTQKRYLDSIYSECSDEEEFTAAKAVLESFLKTENGDVAQFDKICDALENNDCVKVVLSGLPGTGKSTLISLLYCYYAKFSPKSRIYPIIIDLHRLGLNANKQEILETDLKSIELFMSQKKDYYRFVICIDGIDDYNSDLRTECADMISQFLKKHKKTSYMLCVSTEEKDKNATGSPVDELTPYINHVQNVFLLERYTLPNSSSDKKFDKLLSSLILLKQNKEKRKNIDIIKKAVTSYGMHEIDYRTILLFISAPVDEKSSSVNLARSIYSYYERIYDLDVACEDAYKYEIHSEVRSDFSLLIQKNDIVRDFLVALFFINYFLSKTEENNYILKEDNSVLNSISNKLFLNLYSTETLSNRKRIVNKMILSLKKEDTSLSMKAQISYFLGRFKDQIGLTERSKVLYDVWMVLYKELFEDNILKQQYDREHLSRLMLFRTVSISLISIKGFEDGSCQEKFLKCILYNEEFSRLNRGFHIAYYCDYKYSNGDQPLLLDDDSLDVVFTMQHLENSVFAFFENPTRVSPLINLNIITLFSFYQSRHDNPTIVSRYSEELNNIGSRILDSEFISVPIVKKYVRMMLHFIQDYSANPYKKVLDDINKFKQYKRKGWVRRDVNQPESISDHIYGTYLIALFFLPDNIYRCDYKIDTIDDYLGYSKRTILDLLLIHDFGEYSKGDIPTPEKTREDDVDEKIAVEFYECFGSFSKLYGLGDYATECYAMIDRDKGDINVQIAKDIDVIERTIQAYHYWKQQDRKDVWNDFYDDIRKRKKLGTVLGKQIWAGIKKVLD